MGDPDLDRSRMSKSDPTRACVLVIGLIVSALATGQTSAFAATRSPIESDATRFVRALQGREPAITTIVTYTEATDANNLLGRPGQYISKVEFVDSRLPLPSPGSELGIDNGGSVEVFKTVKDATARFKYVDAITHSSSLFGEYHCQYDTVFLRLSLALTPAQAAEYDAAARAVIRHARTAQAEKKKLKKGQKRKKLVVKFAPCADVGGQAQR